MGRKLNNKKSLFQKAKEVILGKDLDYTSIPLNKAIIYLSIPMILEMVMESLFAVVDIFFVSSLGENAITTVGLTESVVIFIYAIGIGLSMATTAIVARRIGEKNREGAAVAASQAIVIGIGVSIIISFLGIFFAKDILYMMQAEPEVVEYGYRYTQIIFGGNITILLIFLINAIFRGAGDASLAMWSLWLANGINIILDPILILTIGLEGAAIATVTGRGIGVLFQCYHLFNGKHIVQLTKRHITIVIDEIKSILSISAGGIGQFIISTASWTFLVAILSDIGNEVVAGYTIAFRVVIFTILPSWGFSNAAAALVGQNLGANKPDRAEQAVWKTATYNVIFLIFVSILFIMFDEEVIQIFINEEDFAGQGQSYQDVLMYGAISLRYMCYGYIFFGFGMVMIQAFNGAGDTNTPTLINFICHWVIQIPLAYVLAFYYNMGPEGVFSAIIIAEACLGVFAYAMFKRGKWREVAV